MTVETEEGIRMKKFDQAFGNIVKERMAALPEDAKPQWGSMSRDQLFGHLNKTLLYTFGEGPEMPFRGTLKTRLLFRYVILFGIKEIPHNVKLPRPDGVSEEQLFPKATFGDLKETIDRYVESTTQAALSTRMHPFFGPFSPSNWQRFHLLHFTHHMKQFGIGEGL